ncbi:hypothetical protein [Granulicella tundricola]|uniref:Uncharacterized protein n=1 Tax=Granulicella tundricola (strain ATCC BAA-1859 / DSM 23138 / MP5ACTX9) TaxID=1198114 RepID=E8WY56_GRATM|nr:hypothetical protein [Granulicella tundricola]ADW68683.1 hypothetical protein AciX9_1631 [Granulicella tundricola MP5ACTX9]
MPAPVKQCPGEFSPEIQQLLHDNADRAQWKEHPCALCGQFVNAELKFSKWLPLRHWPSVNYAALRNKAAQKKARPTPTPKPVLQP